MTVSLICFLVLKVIIAVSPNHTSPNGSVAELVDALVLGTSAERRAGSSPA